MKIFDCYIKINNGVVHGVFQKRVPTENCILRKAFNASLDKCKLIRVRPFKAISN